MALTVLLTVTVIAACSVVPANAEAVLQLTTNKSVYALGEEVTITLENVGNEYREIGGWPCVIIYTRPASEPVWPIIFATLLWGLAPGESETWIWNQTNEYTGSPAEPGMYVVNDTLGLGLSAEFEITSFLRGDVNLDHKVDVLDAALVSAHWYPGPPLGPLGYDSGFDVNGDAAINVLDSAVVSACWTGPPKGPQAP
jgi:hypothetical protein